MPHWESGNAQNHLKLAAFASDLHAVGRLALWLFDGKPPLFWRWFVMRATNSSPALRYKSAKAMKRALAAARLSWLVSCALAAAIPVAIAAFLLFHEEPPPIRLDTYEAHMSLDSVRQLQALNAR